MILTSTKQKYLVSAICSLIGMFLSASTLRFDTARNVVVIITGIIVAMYIVYVNILYNVLWGKRIEKPYTGKRYDEYAYVECYDTLTKTLTVRGNYDYIPMLSTSKPVKNGEHKSKQINDRRYVIKAVWYDDCTEVEWLGVKYLTNKPKTLFFNILLRDILWVMISNYLFGIAFALLFLYGMTEGIATTILYVIIVLVITFPYEVVNRWRYEQ